MQVSSPLLIATALPWTLGAGGRVVTVVAKATLALVPGVCELAPEQHGFFAADGQLGPELELVPIKQRVDVVALGSGSPPLRPPATAARLLVGALDKRLDRAGIAALGPIELSRSPHGATGSADWTSTWRTSPMPPDAEASMFNVAPADQQLDDLAPDAELRLEHLLAELPVLSTRLPGIRITARTELPAGLVETSLRLDTVIFELDRDLVTLVHRGLIAVPAFDVVGRITLDVNAAAPLPTRRPAAKAALIGLQTIMGGDVTAPALPFAGSNGARQAVNARSPEGLPFQDETGRVAPAPQPVSFDELAMQTLPHFPAAGAVIAPPLGPPPSPPPGPPAPAPALDAPRPAVEARPPGADPHPPGWRPVPVAASAFAPPARVLRHEPSAAIAGLAGASDAAADGETVGQVPRRKVPATSRVLWHAQDAARRMLRVPDWKRLRDKGEKTPRKRGEGDPDEASDVALIVAGASPSGEQDVRDALARAHHDAARFEPQLVLLAGSLQLAYDPIERLAATVATATPLARGDEPLRQSVEAGAAFLAARSLVSPRAVARTLADAVSAAYHGWKARTLPETYVDDAVARALVEARAFERRDVFGEAHLRGGLTLAGSTMPIPLYLPEAAGKLLPLAEVHQVRVIAEVHHREDETEALDLALLVRVVARVLPEIGAS